jgi:hypothetical protein
VVRAQPSAVGAEAAKVYFERIVQIGPVADAQSVDVPEPPPELAPAPAPDVAPHAPVSRPLPLSPPREPPTRARSGDAARIASYAVGGVGLAALAVGTVFVIRTDSLKNDSESLAAQGNREALAKASDARSAQTIARIGFGVGVVAIVAAASLYFTAPRARAPKSTASSGPRLRMMPEIGPTMASFGVGGTW